MNRNVLSDEHSHRDCDAIKPGRPWCDMAFVSFSCSGSF